MGVLSGTWFFYWILLLIKQPFYLWAWDWRGWEYDNEQGHRIRFWIYDQPSVSGEEWAWWQARTNEGGVQQLTEVTDGGKGLVGWPWLFHSGAFVKLLPTSSGSYEGHWGVRSAEGRVVADYSLWVTLGNDGMGLLPYLGNANFREGFGWLPVYCAFPNDGFLWVLDHIRNVTYGYCLVDFGPKKVFLGSHQ
ncbi:MAG: hypothetical protein NZ480_07815 [Bdellovibrionaceae bacterium]|nr:hypothetical protein [Pseudobdellovibrionaceae bacterium]MDW8189506.1 hypothetical protein [Pseudobdellovibrionaceae bacterium]